MRVSKEQDMSRQGGEVSVIQQLVSQIDVFLSLKMGEEEM